MPIVLLLILAVIFFGISFITFGIGLDESPGSRKSLFKTALICSLILGGISCWIYVAWDQDEVDIKYQPLVTTKKDNGQMQYVELNQNDCGSSINVERLNVTEAHGTIFPEGTYVKIYRKKSYKNGIFWMNGDTYYIKEFIVPTHPKYAEIAGKAKK